MNRKIYASLLVVLVCLTFGFLTGCSNSKSTPPPPTIAITAASADTPQSTMVGTAFTNPLGVTVTSDGSPLSGATVTFSAPSSGASCALSAATATTAADGTASVTCTANSTAGSYNVTATTTNATTPATFALTNTSPTTFTFVFDASGAELINGGPNYYAVAGAFTIDESQSPPAVTSGKLDYNDGFGITETDTINSGTATIGSTTGTGTITLVTSSTAIGSPTGTVTLAVQFANASHALVSQFDGTATSSGSMDLQTATDVTGGGMGYAFTLNGVDYSYNNGVAYGGVFALASGAQNGFADENDGGTVTIANVLSGTSTPDPSFLGRGTAAVTVGSTNLSLVYYVVGPEVMRLIDMDATPTGTTGNAMLGSAYGQGTTTTFDNTSLGNSVFGVGVNYWYNNAYAAAGMIVPNSSAGTFTAVGDDDEDGTPEAASVIAGTYSVSNLVNGTAVNGYSTLTINQGSFFSTNYGMYMVDPTINILDPNAATGGGGALLVNLDTTLPTTTGVLIPQTDTTDSFSSADGVYAFGSQEFLASFPEFDQVGQSMVTSSTQAFAGTGDISDPYGWFTDTLGTGAEYTSEPYAGTVAPDGTNAERYTISPLAVGPVGSNPAATNFDIAIYQGDANTLLWVNNNADGGSLGFGTMEAQTGPRAFLKGKPGAKAAAKTSAKGKR